MVVDKNPWLVCDVFQRHCYVISKKALSAHKKNQEYNLYLRIAKTTGLERVLTLSGPSKYVWPLIDGKRTKQQIASSLEKYGIVQKDAKKLVNNTLNLLLNFSPEPLIYPIWVPFPQEIDKELSLTISNSVNHFPIFFDATYILDTQRTAYNANFLLYHLDTEIWNHIVKGTTLRDLIRDITERFGERATIKHILSFLAILKDSGTISVIEGDDSFLQQYLPEKKNREAYGRLPRPHYTYGGPKVLRFLRYTENPWYVVYEITYRCNLKCRHCYAAAYEYYPDDELNLEAIKHYILSPMIKAPVPHVTIMGGEPLVHKDLCKIITFLRDNKTFVKLQTNGTLLNEEWANNLNQSGVNQVEVSIDGINAYTNDRIRGSGTFVKALRALENLRQTNIPRIGLCFTVTSFNFNQIPDVPEWAIDRGINEIFYSKFFPMGRGAHLREWCMTKAQREKLEKEIIPQQQQTYPNITIFGIYTCLAGQKYCAISPKGIMRPCTLHKAEVANLLEQPFLDTWQNNLQLNQIRFFYREKKVCNGCVHIHSCAGTECSARTFSRMGKMVHPECFLRKYGRRS
ncbi:MAG: radical SAM protein [Promethearchaeota archaeon]